MTTIKAKFKGQDLDLRMLLTVAIKFNSDAKIEGNTLTVIWHCEETDYIKALKDCMDCIDLNQVKNWNCEGISIL